MKIPSQPEAYLARTLFSSRFLVLFAVVGALLASGLLFLKSTFEILHGAGHFLKTLAHLSLFGAEDKTAILTVIPVIDHYLFATVLLIFGIGIYDLFIGGIDPMLNPTAFRPAWIKVKNLDDLRAQISEVVIMILIINFFDLSFAITLDRPLDLLMLGGGIFFVAAALFITQRCLKSGSE